MVYYLMSAYLEAQSLSDDTAVSTADQKPISKVPCHHFAPLKSKIVVARQFFCDEAANGLHSPRGFSQDVRRFAYLAHERHSAALIPATRLIDLAARA